MCGNAMDCISGMMMQEARALCAVRTADEASDSSGDMGTGARFMMALNSE